MIDIRPVAYVIGRILVVLAILMVAPAIIDWRAGDPNGIAFAQCAMITGVVGGALSLATVNGLGPALDVRQAYLLTAAIWIVVPGFGALPLYFGAPGLSYPDAFFESVSGFTTTGATVIFGLESLPVGMNLWRGMIQFFGGLGIAFIAMIFLPLMRIGGMQFFRTEGFDTFGKALPRATDIARQLLFIYVALNAICIVVYLLIGMTPLDAVVNGFATIATGGFSPADVSFNKYQGAGEYFGALFMVLGSLPYIRYVQLVNASSGPLWRDSQVRTYLRWLMSAVLIVTVWRVSTSDMGWEAAFRESLFNLTSIMSSTGFFSGSFPTWGGFMLVVAFVVGVVGACSGSSAAGLSVFRVQVAMAALRREVRRIANPSSIDPVKYEGRTVEKDVLDAVVMFLSGYILLLGIMSVAMTLVGVDPVSALFAVWTALGNIGYGFGPLVERTGTFIDFPNAAILIMTLCMILGRLGLLAILVLVLPAFWRR
ncbi:MAG: TrkH family potassium uptake protein [Tabrizicola sp.]|uniref:TrkH family potassium uptake protein n=1 Tax=Tabrizicola sp. TaxID=2005166 RepID=UPI002736BF6C|nr:TrkH family potassium uptake protein [Tabrizicola sp.]MDP3261767.1 TrkH family potassium uptake protein [Tabrizicola sp.]MDP3648849.1 TrkH family potassium uptake protein [Paracoccaceae bacterium]MDZ4065750.1 TrkH family potassium uptake protein [Tabrizicola sp.]